MLLLGLRDDRIRVNLPLNGVKSEWIAVAFIENDALIVAKAKDGQTFTWPFYPDVPSLQKLAKDYLPFVRNEDGSRELWRLPVSYCVRPIPPSDDTMVIHHG